LYFKDDVELQFSYTLDAFGKQGCCDCCTCVVSRPITVV